MKKWMSIFCLLLPSFSFAWSKEEIRRILDPQKNYYEILNVKPDASADEIKAAIRSLRRTYHPDFNNKFPEKRLLFTEVIKKINLSSDTLRDPLKRNQYDQTLPKPPPTQSRPYSAQTAEEEARAARREREFKEAAKARESGAAAQARKADEAKWANAKKWEPGEVRAKRLYEETAKCGDTYFKNFIDILL
ncbi:MAG: J domain-containing protein [Pseudobdellovibrionaceae bacterium]